MAVTLASLAAQVGVDPSLVSRVLRGDPKARISDEKRTAILDLAEATGYRPNRLGKSLRMQRTFVLGMLTPDITNPFHSWLFRSVERTANAAGYDVILCNTDDDVERTEKLVRTLSEGHVDGLIVAAARKRDASVDLLRKLGMPYVVMNRPREGVREPWYGPDALQVGRLGGEHLVALGHRRIAVLNGDSGVGSMDERVEGFRAALRESGVEPDERLIVTDLLTRADAEAALRELLGLPEGQRPTALFVPNTILMGGALIAVREEGVRVPGDLSIVGYSATETPEITAVCVPTDEIGRRATLHLIEHLAAGGEGVPEGGGVALPVSLVDRGTTGPAP